MAQVNIFVSHSHQDNERCHPFADALKAVGYDVWYDETGLQGGAAWVANIQHEVESREVFLLVLTPDAWESKWVQDELQLAIATRRRVLPVLLRNTQVSGFLLTTQWITVIGEEPQAAARASIIAIEAPPAPGRNAAPEATTETLDDLILLCRSLSTEGRYTEALSACARALALDSNNISALKIKAYVLGRVNEPRLEGRTWFQVLLLDPDDEYMWSSDTWKKVFSTLSDENELLQAYSLLFASNNRNRRNLFWPLFEGLSRIKHVDAAIDILAAVNAELDRQYVYAALRGVNRSDLIAPLLVKWHGYPSSLRNISDLHFLDEYAQTVAKMGRSDEAKSVRQDIVSIFEAAYSNYLNGVYSRTPTPSSPPWTSTVYKIHLAALDELGRALDASWLRKNYPLADSDG